ncbi:MAG: hypothetical protein Q7W45_13860 [Bacteroidota bacterium]|nr:hypothetical protein [Bacteroidota bacterium]MDP3144392.1 hypothetical protein [Bacteroidota bacterium]
MANHFKDNQFLFWQRWLFYSSLIFALAGIAFAFLGNNLFFLPYEKMVANSLWHSSEFPPEADVFRAFVYLPFGGTIACCYILLAFIAWYPFKEKKVWARNAIIIAFSFWVIIDSLGCLYFKVYQQIYIINAFSIMVKALPIVFTWKDFRQDKRKVE